MKFYTYLWLRENGTPYYVGKGKGDRAFRKGNHRQKPPIAADKILIQEFPDESSAHYAEMFFIALYGREDNRTGCLRNMTNGGEGISGLVFSEQSKRKMSSSQKNRTDRARFGRILSAESRDKIRNAHRSKPKPFGCSSNFKNVHKTPSGKYRVILKVNGKSKHLGTFNTEEEAVSYVQNIDCHNILPQGLQKRI